jgi:hypothetical protein
LAITPDTIPPPVPDLAVAAAAPAAARIRGIAGPGTAAGISLRVGLVWAGNSNHPADNRRSCPLPFLRPLFDVPGIAWFSLQQAHVEPEIAGFGFADRLTGLGALLTDMAETAAAIAALDLVITVDTSVAHLAGTMGKETWLLLAYVADWRWPARGETTAWYPSLRLFRQIRPGHWPELVTRLRTALEERLSGGRA